MPAGVSGRAAGLRRHAGREAQHARLAGRMHLGLAGHMRLRITVRQAASLLKVPDVTQSVVPPTHPTTHACRTLPLTPRCMHHQGNPSTRCAFQCAPPPPPPPPPRPPSVLPPSLCCPSRLGSIPCHGSGQPGPAGAWHQKWAASTAPPTSERDRDIEYNPRACDRHFADKGGESQASDVANCSAGAGLWGGWLGAAGPAHDWSAVGAGGRKLAGRPASQHCAALAPASQESVCSG